MKLDFADAMRGATRATRSGDVLGATKIILSAVTGRAASAEEGAAAADPGSALRLDGPDRESRRQAEAASSNAAEREQAPRANAASRARMPLGDVVRALREGRRGLLDLDLERLRPSRPPPTPDGARFITMSFSGAAGVRDYKLYLPASRPDLARGLIVMLHGCTQNPDDFAAGTNMNAVAEAHGLMVAYPHQPRSANASACWNWFNPADQARNAGEPSLISGITREVLAEFAGDPRRVFVAGLSAGGAMAAVMGATYPDLYTGVGIHSGLDYRSASDVASALSTMRGAPAPDASSSGASATRTSVPTIVFHGSRDRTVHLSNAERIVEAARARLKTDSDSEVVHGVENGRGYARTTVLDSSGAPAIEFWRIEGAGHAWSGGRREGSYADPKGPDASAQMVRFFLAQAPRV